MPPGLLGPPQPYPLDGRARGACQNVRGSVERRGEPVDVLGLVLELPDARMVVSGPGRVLVVEAGVDGVEAGQRGQRSAEGLLG